MSLSKNTKVSWKWLGKTINGRVLEIFQKPVIKEIKGKKIKRNGSKKNPAYLVLSDAGNEALKLASELIVPTTPKQSWKTPRIFSDQPVDEVLPNAVLASDLKNLGPATDKAFNKAGIKGAQHFIKLGWKKTMIKLVAADKKNCHSIFAYALIGALTNTIWNRISEADKKEAQKFCNELREKLKKTN